ncbi:hypothetical protein GH714_014211 [Hevea brasiliensis]|uniref:Uncharacterized protein n=1 Tax=Hevea brasiliensis TaxID=3981 RepID=A0A6A6N3R1_HEVBR|nr:hypothetical protein GH714_014211 [Hevea brasiliensis]
MPSKVGRLTSLERLSLFAVGTHRGGSIEELECLNQLSGELKIMYLEKVGGNYHFFFSSLGVHAELVLFVNSQRAEDHTDFCAELAELFTNIDVNVFDPVDIVPSGKQKALKIVIESSRDYAF